MGFWSTWFKKFWFTARFKFVRLIDIKPVLQTDACEYCPVCGCRDKHEITAVTDGVNTAVRHQCPRCRWIWETPSVTEIDPKSIVHIEPPEKDEEGALSDKREMPKFVAIPPKGDSVVKVNGEPLLDKAPGPGKPTPKKEAVPGV